MATETPAIVLHDPPSLGPPHPLYANITTVPISTTHSLFTIAGQIAAHPDGTIPTALPAQISLCLSRISTCLESIGAKLENVTRLMYYVVERAFEGKETLELVSEVVGKWLAGKRPASCFLVVKSLSREEFLCEFEAMGVVATMED